MSYHVDHKAKYDKGHMNMLRSNSNNSKSSDRVALFSNSNNDTTTTLGRKVKHETDTPSQFEQQNDYRLEELNSKLSALHKVMAFFNLT
ncbi:17295_t:CDS:2 [Cetraspora pellucida]|uniref:17295_t:CDS:1 n=1 Tax=Cetraspora pellucida TaxID=1433469 RepID=A0ACA9JYX1_9GLOM|nr:17295_t:CDS:2 [Cetraspora pellucida]